MTTTNTQRTARELTPAIGATVLVRFEQLTIEARVLDAKNTWNKVRLLIRPIAGGGEQWIELSRLVAAVATGTHHPGCDSLYPGSSDKLPCNCSQEAR
jgi:hypothetical protein